ncbi:MAG: hypothetical protein PGN12_05945 [Sphingomonas phyllosphaerae]
MRVVLDSGESIELGTVETAPTITITDYSRRVTDDFGVTTVVERGFSRRMSVKLKLPFTDVDVLQRRLASLRATPAKWIADEQIAWLSARGFFKDFDLDLNLPPVSYCTLSVEGFTQTEIAADPGINPTLGGGTPTLRLLQPVALGEAMLAQSSVAETDAASWAAGSTYAAGVRVMRAHVVYESLVAGNKGRDPITDPAAWLTVGPTNRWAMFDQALGTATSANGSIVVGLEAGSVNAVALLDVAGSTVRVQATGYDRTIAVDAGAITFLDLPTTSGRVTVTIAGSGQVSVGTLLVGTVVGLGTTEQSPSAGITDYSRKEVDDFGGVTVVQRSWAKRMSVRGMLRTDAVDAVANRIAAVRARPSLWIGDAGTDSLTVYGFFKEFSIEVGERFSKLSLSVEGLSDAAPTGPLTIPWENISDPKGTRPTNNADVTGQNTSKDTNAVGGKPAADVLKEIAATTAQQKQLTDVTIPAVNKAVADAGDRITAAKQRADDAFQNADSVNRRVDELVAGGNEGIDTEARAEIQRVDEAAISRDAAAARESVAIEARMSERVSASARDVTTAYTEADRALGSRASTLEVSALSPRTTTLNANPDFSFWPDANGNTAPGWVWWANVVGAAMRIAAEGRRGGYAYRHDMPAGIDMGWQQTPILIDAGWWVMEADTILRAGSYLGTGMTVDGVYSFDFAREADTNGTVSSGGIDKRRRWSKLVKINEPRNNWHLMQNWGGFAPMEAKQIDWYYCGIRPATDAEIAARKAIDVTIPAVTARVKASEDTLADLPDLYAAASRAAALEAQVNLATDSGLKRALSAQIEDRATAIADAKAGAVAQSLETVRSSLNDRVGQVEVQAGAISGIDQRTSVYWRVVGTTPDGQAMISLSKSDGSSPLFYVGANMLVRGDLIVDGAVTLRTLNRATMTATTQASRTGPFAANYNTGVVPVDGIAGDMPIGDGGSLYFTVSAAQISSTNGAVAAAYPSVQLLDTANNVLGDYKIPLADSRIGGLANYVVRAINMWGARTIRWRLVNRGTDQAYTHMNDPSASLYWTAL